MNSNIDQKIFASTFKKVGENTQQIARVITSSDNTNIENQQEVVSFKQLKH